MRIGIDAPYAFRAERRGIGRSLRILLGALQDVDHDNEYVVYLDGRAESEPPGGCPRWRYRILRGLPVFREQVGLPRAVVRDRIDVLHCAANIAPVVKLCPTVLTLYDVIEFRRRAVRAPALTWRHRLSRVYRMGVTPRVARSADLVIAPSRHAARDIQEVLGIDPTRIAVVPLAIDPRFREAPRPAEVAATLTSFGIAGDFLLALAPPDTRKNALRLLDALAILNRRGRRLPLVLASGPQARYDTLLAHPEWEGLRRQVVRLGFVTDDELRHLYHAARIFVYPSMYEGFGLPPLEAMACGTPVVCSDSSSLPETVGDAALLFDARDAEDLAAKIEACWDDGGLAGRLVARGQALVRALSWDAVARETLATYVQVGRRALPGGQR